MAVARTQPRFGRVQPVPQHHHGALVGREVADGSPDGVQVIHRTGRLRGRGVAKALDVLAGEQVAATSAFAGTVEGTFTSTPRA